MATKASIQVYLSFCERDVDWVNRYLIKRLRKANIGIIEFELGRPVLMEIQRAIEETEYTLMVISESYLKNRWGKFQSILTTTSSVNNDTWRGLPIIIEQCDLPPFLGSLVRLDLIEQSEEKWARLLKTLLGDQHAFKEIDGGNNLVKADPALDDLIVRFKSIREQANTLHTNVRMSRPFLSQLRKLADNIQEFFTSIDANVLKNDALSLNEFDKIHVEHIYRELDRAKIAVVKGVRLKSSDQKSKYIRQTRQALSSIVDSIHSLENTLKGRE